MKFFVVLVFGVFLVSCGKRYELVDVVGEVVSKQEAVVGELGQVKDVASAKVVAGRIDILGDELVEVGAKLGRLEELDDEGRRAARGKFLEGVERMRYGVKAGLRGVESDPEAARILAEALERYEEKVGGVEERLRGELFGDKG